MEKYKQSISYLIPFFRIVEFRVDIEDVRPGNSEVFHGRTVAVSARVVGARPSEKPT